MENILFQALTILVIVAGMFYSIILHEVAHGFAAFCFGDNTAKDAKRLSLNPIRHIDPLGTVILPAVFFILSRLGIINMMFGWAKPVPINPALFKHQRAGMIVVSLAGVAVNFLLAGLFIFLTAQTRFGAFAQIGIFNIMLVVFNLLPFPPLDGYRFVMSIIPLKWSNAVQTRIDERIFMGILLVLIMTGLIRYFYSPFFAILLKFFVGLFGIRGAE